MTKIFLKLTRLHMRKLEPGERVTEHGITFERLADGDGAFSVNVMVDRRRITENSRTLKFSSHGFEKE